MTIAACVLAVAVLVAPTGPRRRAGAPPPTGVRATRSPVVFALVGCAVIGVLLSPTAAVAGGLLVATLVVRRRIGRRRTSRIAESTALQEALDVLVGELRVGAHPVAALSVAAQESRGRVAGSLRAVAARAALGADVAAGLRIEGGRSPTPAHWDRLAVCWQLAHSYGLAVATLMQAAQRDIAERDRFRGRVEAGMAGARATAVILAALPAVCVALGHAIGARPLDFLLSGGPGGWLLIIGTAFICAGLLWSDRITSRVLG